MQYKDNRLYHKIGNAELNTTIKGNTCVCVCLLPASQAILTHAVAHAHSLATPFSHMICPTAIGANANVCAINGYFKDVLRCF